MTNNDSFLQQYKKFEDWARVHYPQMKDMQYLENNYSLRDYCKTLEFYRKTRNLLTHYGNIGVTPVPEMINLTDAMLAEFNAFTEDIKQPALNKAVPKDKIISYTVDDKVILAARDMVNRNYTHSPVMRDGKVIGLFGENSLFNIICKGKKIDGNTTFGDIMDDIDIYQNSVARSIDTRTTTPECKYKFRRAIERNERLDLVFITNDGTYKTPVQGLITIWDLPGIK